MSDNATMREVVTGLLPRGDAKRWISALEIKRSDKRVNRRSLYSVLRWMVAAQLAVKRKNAVTGLLEYAKPVKARR
jgi:hypothetical protein